METQMFVPTLAIFTLIAGVIIAAGLMIVFLRKHSNRAATEHALKMDGTSQLANKAEEEAVDDTNRQRRYAAR